MKPAEDLAAIVEVVQPFPHVAARVSALANDPSRGVAELARALEDDVGLSSEVLRIVNSAASGLTKPCTSVRRAAALLGASRIARLASTAATLSTVKSMSAEFPHACAHALAVAAIARLLASRAAVEADDAYVAGLVHDIGSVILLQRGDAEYMHLLEDSAEPAPSDERIVLGFDHAELGAAVLRSWKFPETMCEAVAHIHDWDTLKDASPAVLAIGAVITVADVLAPLVAQHSTPRRVDLDLADQHPAFACIGLTRDGLAATWEGIRTATARGESAVFDIVKPEPTMATAQPEREERRFALAIVVFAVCALAVAALALRVGF